MNPAQAKRISKFLSLVLRHQPDKIGLQLDSAGWAEVDELLEKVSSQAFALDRASLEEVVAGNEKQRFAFSEDGQRIRASQGHSIEVELEYQPVEPPEQLYHGTTGRFLDSIRAQGLLKRSRQHVHLSPDRETAQKVGQRHGPPVILTVEAGDMHRTGHVFYCSANGVWLVEAVPPEFIGGL
ncbi:MAG: RNA 2'-phosphotransferase [Candidatus Sericytochromatia bacterium]